MSNSKYYDIAIVGAGPGGSIAAKIAADYGFSVLLLEREALGNGGRYKACGGALAWELVDEIKYPEEKIERVIECLELHHTSGQTFSKKGKGAVVWRSVFDKHLTDMAIKSGAVMRENEPLLAIQKELDGFYVIKTPGKSRRAKFILAADGVASKTLTLLKWPKFRPEDLVLTITQEMKSTPGHIKQTLHEDCVHLFFGIKDLIPLGYAWLFPKSDTITVGWGNNLSKIYNTKTEFQKFKALPMVQTSLGNSSLVLEKPHMIPVGIRSLLYQENVFAIGDAGGLVDPISGKGIPYAMMSGKIAVESIKKAFDKGKVDQLGQLYVRKLNSTFLSVLKAKQEARGRIFASDESLIQFLDLWQRHRSSEIIVKKML